MAFSLTRRVTWAGSVASAIVAIAAALALFNVPVPRPVWASELQMVEGKLLELDNIITTDQLDDVTLRLYQNLREQNRYERIGDEIPDLLLQEQSTLEGRKRMLENRLEIILEESSQ